MVLDDSVMARNDALREMMGFARAIIEDGDAEREELAALLERFGG